MKSTPIQDLVECYLRNPSDVVFKRLYTLLEPGLKNFIKKYITDADLINEIFSDTMLRVMENILEYNATWNFTTWVYTIAKNQALQELKRQHRNISISGHNQQGEPIDVHKLEILNPEDYVDTLDSLKNLDLYEKKTTFLINLILMEIKELKPIYRDILWDLEINQFTYGDLADKYHLPMSTVQSRIFIGRGILKRNSIQTLKRTIRELKNA